MKRPDYENGIGVNIEVLYKVQVWTEKYDEWYTDHISTDYGRILKWLESYTHGEQWRVVETYETHRVTLLGTDRTPRSYRESAARILGQA